MSKLVRKKDIQCTYRNQVGSRCLRRADPNSPTQRCSSHSGALYLRTHPNQSHPDNAISQLYSNIIHEDDEKQIFYLATIGDLEFEIRMTKVRLYRAYKLQAQFEHALKKKKIDDNGFITWEKEITTGFDPITGRPIKSKKIIKRRTDYRLEIASLQRQLIQTEKTRAEIAKIVRESENGDQNLISLINAISAVRSGKENE